MSKTDPLVVPGREGRPHEVAETYVPTIHGEPHEGYLHDGTASPVDQAQGTESASEAAQARRDIEGQLTDGSLTLTDLFQMSDAETGDSHRTVGHMHLRAALLALPGIGEVKADAILAEVGIKGDRHIDSLGSKQREKLAAAVDAA